MRACFGDGADGPCPCENPGTPGGGCGQAPGGFSFQGGQLHAEGSASVTADDLRRGMVVAWFGETPVVLISGTDHGTAQVFGDGLLCLSDALTRVTVRTKPTRPGFGPGLAAHEGYAPGDRRAFQVRYRTEWGPASRGSTCRSASS